MRAEAFHAQELDALRPSLLRIARLHLRNDAWAEDTVSETLLAALESSTVFEGRSKLKTWLVGILKHKIIDCLRVRSREIQLIDEGDDGDIEGAVFKDDGHYRETPHEWSAPGSTPEATLNRIQFFEILEACVQQLPAPQARIFMLREWMEFSTEEICNQMTITATNAGVLLHRARLRLRECLELRWFNQMPR